MGSKGLIREIETPEWVLNRTRGPHCMFKHPSLMDDTIERVNVALPRRVLARLDARAKAGLHISPFLSGVGLRRHRRTHRPGIDSHHPC